MPRLFERLGVMIGQAFAQHLPGALHLAGLQQRAHQPGHGMGILPAVFAHAGQVCADIPGFFGGRKGRGKQQRNALIALMQRLPGSLQRLRNLIARHAGKAGEALADQVDARHFTIRRAQRAAVLIPGAQKPLACPGSLHGALQLDALRVQLPAHAFLA